MRFSDAQLRVLRSLDGATGPVSFTGDRKRTIDSLQKAGVVTYRQERKSSKTFYYPGGTTLVLYVSLTKKGGDFIYEGGIDK